MNKFVQKTFATAKRFCAAAFSGTTINAESGVVEQHPGILARPQSGLSRLFSICILLAIAIVALSFAGVANAQTDMTDTISTVSGYWDAVKVVAIAILLFVVGRRVVKKL